MTEDAADAPESTVPASTAPDGKEPEDVETFVLERRDITLGNLLKIHLVMSGGQAKRLVQDGLVSVNGELCEARGRRLFGGELVEIDGDAPVRVHPCPNP